MTSSLEIAWNDVASKLRSYIRSRVRDHAAAEDILQDVFLKAHKRAPDSSSVANMEGWLFFIAKNAVADYYRRSKTTTEVPEELPAESNEGPLTNADFLQDSFRKMIMTLPDPYRDALLLTEFEGLTQKQLAARLGISLSGAKSRVQRGREKLKQSLLDCCKFEFDRRGNIIECEPRDSVCRCPD